MNEPRKKPGPEPGITKYKQTSTGEGSGQYLSHRRARKELLILEAIRANPGITIIDLSHLLGITKVYLDYILRDHISDGSVIAKMTITGRHRFRRFYLSPVKQLRSCLCP